MMREWGRDLLADPNRMDTGWYQPFVVLSYCRMLQTLETGRIESKRAGADWDQARLGPHWAGLIERAWEGRRNPDLMVRQKADPEDLQATIEFVRRALGLTTR